MLFAQDGKLTSATRTISAPGGVRLSFTNADAAVVTLLDVVRAPSHVIDMGRPETGVERLRSDVFGAAWAIQPQSPTVPARHGFTGGRPGFSDGLVKFGARDYDPATGRFISPDPVSSGGGRWAAPSGVTTAPTTADSSGGKGSMLKAVLGRAITKGIANAPRVLPTLAKVLRARDHLNLEGCGLFLEVIGAVCDLENAVLSEMEGNREDAVFSAVGAVPLLGIASTVFKWAKGVPKAVRNVNKAYSGLTDFTRDVLALKPGKTSDVVSAPRYPG